MLNRVPLLLSSALLSGLAALPPAQAQTPKAQPSGDVFVDKQGVLRWQKGKQEVSLFGVNYTAPFAHAYRMHQRLGVNLEQAIAQDVYHLSRLGLDAFRVHVWDVEITDTVGNLQENEHLRLLDFLVAQLKQRGIKVILTPIAYWNNGYPEQDTGTGFSSIYSKTEAYTNPRAIEAQERYLTQFLNHRNPYTKQFNREDPDIIAFEVCNEPRYHKPEAQVTAFADRMAQAIRATGCRKPVFYNVSENPDVYEAILNAQVDGLTFQWYPQGLVSGHALRGNFLPYVDQYPIPFRQDKRFTSKARMIYEFESADIIQPVMYPFMARSFREAGFQWATQFAYDPMAIAFANTEYQTHYLNLAYTPAKALSMLIASKVFHRVGRGQSFPRYPQDSVFNAFRVSYREGLSEMNTPEEFYYTASTSTQPKKAGSLQHLAGVGSSPVVRYGGTGAYFLDRVAPGVWRLEVLPDAVPIRDPFEKASLSKPVTQILWNTQPLQVTLPELGSNFSVRGLNEGNTVQAQATGGSTTVQPGVYLLAAAGKSTTKFTAQTAFNQIKLGEFAAPAATKLGPQVRHTAPMQVSAGQPVRIKALLTGAEPQDSVFLVAQHYYGRTRVLPMTTTSYATVEATVPADLLYPGELRYWIVLRKGQQATTFPGGHAGQPRDWDYYHPEHFSVPIVATGTPLPLFRASNDQEQVEARGISPTAWTDYVTTPAGNLALRLVQSAPRPEQPQSATPATGPAAALRMYFADKLTGRASELNGFQEVVVKGRASQGATPVKVVLMTKDAVAYSATVQLGPEVQELRVPLSAFRPDALLLTPRPYPGFLALTYQPATQPAFRLSETEVLQVVLDAPAPATGQLHVDLESVFLR